MKATRRMFLGLFAALPAGVALAPWAVKAATKTPRLIPFQFATTQSYMLPGSVAYVTCSGYKYPYHPYIPDPDFRAHYGLEFPDG